MNAPKEVPQPASGDTLLPCPFCGAQPIVERGPGHETYIVCKTPLCAAEENYVADPRKWNRRAASGAPQEAPGDAPSDSQMLDWLSQRKHSFEFSTPGDHIAKKAWLVTLETGKSDRYGPICTEFDGDTLRDCISAAMKGPQ